MLKNSKLLTSNLSKLNEFQSILGDLITIKQGVDLKEVDADPLTVMIYKSKDAGVGTIVEDTVLYVDGQPIVDIRFKMDNLANLKQSSNAIWKVMLGHNDGTNIYFFEAEVHGVLRPCKEVPSNSFGFDPYFFIESENASLSDLEKNGRKKDFSARKLAIDKMLNGIPFHQVALSDIKEWRGSYQS